MCIIIVVNSIIVIVAAKGIITHKNTNLLKEHGVSVELGKKWQNHFCCGENSLMQENFPPDFPKLSLVL